MVSSGNLLEILFLGQELVEYLIEMLGLLSGLIVSNFLTKGLHHSGYSIHFLFKNVQAENYGSISQNLILIGRGRN